MAATVLCAAPQVDTVRPLHAQFTSVELGSERWMSDGSFSCASTMAANSPVNRGSLFLREHSKWTGAAGNRFRRPYPNPTGIGPLRIGLDITSL